VLVVIVTAIVAGVAVYANYGPVQAYNDARSRLEQASTAVSSLEAEKVELQAQLGKLSEVGYLESLAREELGYLRPGEELYIVTGLEDAAGSGAGTDDGAERDPAAVDGDSSAETEVEAATDDTADEPGLLERAISALMGIF
jgi:cell division protein FtsB